MAAFVNRCHQGCLDEVLVGPNGDAHIKGAAEAAGEWMWRLRDQATREVVAHPTQDALAQDHLLLYGEMTFQAGGIDGVATGLDTLQQCRAYFAYRTKQCIQLADRQSWFIFV